MTGNPLEEPTDLERKRFGAVPEPTSARKGYRPPRLSVYGDLRTLTLGGSPGMGDSGPTTMVRKPL